MTVAQNNENVRDRNQSAVRLPVTTNLVINAGDLVYWDGTNYTVTPLTLNSQVASNFLGMALQSNAALIYPGDADQVGILVEVRGHVWMYTTAAETYLPFDDVTVGADSQTIVKSGSSSSNRVGFVVLDPPAVPRPLQATPVPEQVTGATGVKIRVCLEPKHKYAVAV
jgi:hypothetical protein